MASNSRSRSRSRGSVGASCGRAGASSASSTAPPPSLLEALPAAEEPYRLEKYHFSELSVADFRLRCAAAPRPVVVTGLKPYLTSAESNGLSLDFLESWLPPELELPVLMQATQTTAAEQTLPAKAFFKRLRAGELVYLSDVSISRYCPQLFAHARVPRYFMHCFSHRTRRANPAAEYTPSLFLGSRGTGTSLHIDQHCSHFWMYLCQGRKRWVTFHPDDAGLLAPTFDRRVHMPRFRDLETLARDPEVSDSMQAARRLDFVLEEGEVLFIPQGTPHEVSNLTDTVAFSANFFDQTNVARACRRMAAKLERACTADESHAELKATLEALRDSEPWPSVSEDLAPEDGMRERSGEAMVGLLPVSTARYRAAVTVAAVAETPGVGASAT